MRAREDDVEGERAVTVRPRAYDAAWMRRGKSETSKRARAEGRDGRARRRGRWMDDADADGWRWGARARWTVFAGVLRDANALAALARSAMGTCDPARAFGAMRAREACGVTTRRGGEGRREARSLRDRFRAKSSENPTQTPITNLRHISQVLLLQPRRLSVAHVVIDI